MTEGTQDKTTVAEKWQKPIPGYPMSFDPWADPGDCEFHEETADWVVAYWESNFILKDGDFDGLPFILEPWQYGIVGHAFGWKRPDGTRRFRKIFIYVPKKNGKTELGAGFGLLMVDVDNENQAEVFSCASDSEQARIVFDAANHMVDKNPKLAKKIIVRPSTKRMLVSRIGAKWKVLSSIAETKHGPNVHLLLVDELHTQKDNALIETLEAGTVSRRQPMILKMTTADHPGDSPCNIELEYAKRVLSGETKDESYMPVIYDGQDDYEEDENCWKDPAYWPKVNPNFGISVQESFFRSEVNRCEVEPSHAEVVKRLHMNIQTDKATRWLASLDWNNCKGELSLEGPCYGGLDLGSTDDLTALSLYWPETRCCMSWQFVPDTTFKAKGEYVIWKKQMKARLIVTPGRVMNDDFVKAKVLEIREAYDLRAIAYDRWNSAGLVADLADDEGVPMVEMGQGYASMSQPSKELEKMVKAGTIIHDGDPVLNWNAGNVEIVAGPMQAIKPVKPKRSSPKKIDGIIALIMAVALSLTTVEEDDHGPAIVVL